jgi:hypothetical protein
MKYLVIENEGLLELGALSLMGASTKRGDSSKIGMFGSGNKYALAYFLRNNIEIKILVGKEEVKIELKKEKFRDREFDVVWIDGEKTSITTEMGQEWSLWQAVRELYSNAVDEGLRTFAVFNMGEFCPSEGITSILVEATPEVENFMFNINDYLAINKEVLFENEHGKVYRKHGSKACIYRKGIKCFETHKDSIYDYDFNDICINESRMVSFSWDVPQSIYKILYACEDVNLVRNILYNLSNGKNYLEHQIDDSLVTIHDQISGAWVNAVEDKNVCPRSLGGYVDDEEKPKTLFLPDKIYNAIVAKTGAKNQPKSFKITGRGQAFQIVEELSELNEFMLKEVVAFLKECKFDIPYIITVVDFKDKDIHGGVGEEEILLALNAFDRGKDWILNVILEEYIHLKHKAADLSRKFQDAAIMELITYMKGINTHSL